MMTLSIKILIENPINLIIITSGEGIIATTEAYNGERTLKAIKKRLAEERCSGQRWARASVFSHRTVDGRGIFIDIENGELHSILE